MSESTIPSIRMEHVNEDSTAEIYVYDDIGQESFFFDLFSAKDMRDAILRAGDAKKLVVRINSMGGSPYQAIAMYNLLKDCGKEVVTKVDGIAASAASVVAMAGSMHMKQGSQLMIHEPQMSAYGDVSELEKRIVQLKSTTESTIGIYAEKSGKSEKSIRIMMEEETWLTAEEAVNEGFANTVDSGIPVPLKVTPNMAMRATQNMKNVPSISLFSATTKPNKGKEMADENTVETPKGDSPETPIQTISMTVAEYEELKANQKLEVEKTEAENPQMNIEKMVTAEAHRVSEIHQIGSTVGFDARTLKKFVDEKTPLEVVQKSALEMMTSTNKPPADDGGDTPSDENTEYRKSYRQAKASGVKMAVTEEEWINSKRISDGKEPLVQTA